MPIPRLHGFELEDQAWFPATIRDLATDYLHFMETRFGLHRPIVAVLAGALRASGSRQILDLCSGGSGPIAALQRALADQGLDVRCTLTDRFPNLSAFRRAEAESRGRINFVAEPVDARAVPAHLHGFRTLFNAFHHFRPADATAVLRSATEAGQPIGIFEIPERTLPIVASFLLTPLVVLLATPFLRPFRWRRLLWTYLIPLVPLTCFWDGLVSQLRAYTVAELDRLAQDVGTETYIWCAGRVPMPSLPGHITYLIGYPRSPAAAGSGA